MAISKSDLYKNEWLDLVFAKRNKSYGAYDLRQRSANTINKAMLITFTTVTALIFGLGYAVRAKTTEIKDRMVGVISIAPPPLPPKEEKIHENHKAAAPHKATQTVVQNLPPVVTPTPVNIEPKKIEELEKNDVGPIDITVPGDGKPNDPGVDLSKGGDKGTGDNPEPSKTTIYDYVDVEPAPVGGMEAWNKFLQKNLRYPAQALDAQKSGKLYLSFVVETNGSISNISVVRGLGYGLDDEAVRVLKLAPAWKPGMQHSHPVRVRYTLPFNFQMDQ